MKIQTGMIIYFIRLFIINLYVYWGITKISRINKSSIKNITLMCILILVLTVISVYLNYAVNFLLSILVLIMLYSIALGVIAKVKVGYALVVTLTSYAICIICYGISIILAYMPYKLIYDLFNIDNLYLNLFILSVIQFVLIYLFFKIKRIRKGFNFLQNKLNNEFSDIVIINVSIIIILLYCLIGANYDEITTSLLVTFVVLGLVTFITIQRLLIMNYKQKLLVDTLKEYEEKIKDKDIEIEKLNDEKFNVSKITHEFYNRQKALELLVKENINERNNVTIKNESQNVLNIIKTLTNEYSEEFAIIKKLPKLESTGIFEIDRMFKYMQNECAKASIEFKLKIIGNIHPLINNIISKNKIETLIGDHIRDAINAVNHSNAENREILVILGIKDKIYELSIYDTGIEFKIETLLKLGLEPTTTYANEGGSGIGFMTTFETLKQCKGSLIIEEYNPETTNYTKSVTIRFDNKNKYKICSYRANIIRKEAKDNRIIIENL